MREMYSFLLGWADKREESQNVARGGGGELVRLFFIKLKSNNDRVGAFV